MKEKDVDTLLKETLSIEDLPSDELNNKVKFLINQNKKEKELSIWWMPAFVSILFYAIMFHFYIFIKFFDKTFGFTFYNYNNFSKYNFNFCWS